MKLFIWRACKGPLPTVQVLRRKGMEVDSMCSICGTGEESELHCLKECIIERQIWDTCDLSGEIGGYFRDFGDMASVCFDWLQRTEHGFFMTVCWAIWTTRNGWVFEEECVPIKSVEYVTKIMKELDVEKGKIRWVRGAKRKKWRQPAGCYKLNVDGRMFGGRGLCAGAVIKGNDGKAHVATSWKLRDC